MDLRTFPVTVAIGAVLGERNRHRRALEKAVNNILLTKIAEETYAQVVDGIPTADVFEDTRNEVPPREHPIFTEHAHISDLAMQRLEEIKDNELSVGEIRVQAQLLGAFRSASPGSRAFIRYLVELTAVIIHQIAVEIFKLEKDSHTRFDHITHWRPPSPKEGFPASWHVTCPTLLRHSWYRLRNQYPNGVADVAGYWAESRIFGGVVLFDRLDITGLPDAGPDSVWIHPNRQEETYRIVKLNEDQHQALVEFLLSDTPDLNLLPLSMSMDNLTREDPEEAPEITGIYRDVWERRGLGDGEFDRRSRDVHSGGDYPSRQDWYRSSSRAVQRKYDLQEKLRVECEAEDSKKIGVVNDEVGEGNDDQSALGGTDAKYSRDRSLKEL